MRRGLVPARGGLLAVAAAVSALGVVPALGQAKVEPSAAMTEVDPPAAPGAQAPDLFSDGTVVTAVWIEPVGDERRRVRLSRFDGSRWSEPTTVHEGARVLANWADTPTVFVHDGRTYVTWPELTGGRGYTLRVVMAEGRGDFSPVPLLLPRAPDAEFGFPSLAPDRQGEVRIFWLDGRKLGHGKDGAMQLWTGWITPEVSQLTQWGPVDRRTCECCATDAVDTPAGPLVVYRDRDGREVRDIAFQWGRRRGRVHADGWTVPGCPVNGPAVDATGDEAAVAYFTMEGEQPVVKVAFGTQEAGFSAPVVVDDEPKIDAPIGRVDVVHLARGEAVVGWLDNAGEEAAIRLRRVAADGRRGRVLTVARTARSRAAGFPRLVRQGDGVLVVYTIPGKEGGLAGRRVPLATIPPPGTEETPAPVQTRGDGHLPTWTLTGLDGSKVELEPGRPTLVNLWATWCEPCIAEMPHLAALARRFPKVRFVGISVDDESVASEVAEVLRETGVTYEVGLDGRGEAFRVFRAEFVPTTVVFDAQGRRVFRRAGPIRKDDPELVRVLRALSSPPKKGGGR